ncbi:penicillin-binding protein activator LpoB [Fodinibius halophilus]|uniref:Penicillin-binding protein activator LpoB n=1 Tax=Fodinibius halophilus TaxID=1736908 RepID=A0A6M1SVD0_9BACT|nr:penicillin-binding protein activator LpoB [Fodinibius halophilus]NGP87536.1 penicillin-binding protein activator LpoB [Fodinibius halophilus]
MKNIKIVAILAFTLFAVSCSTSNKVTRVETDTQTDLSGKWNDTDARRVADKMTSNILSAGWLQNAGEQPVLIVGNISNNTMEHIQTGLFIKEIEKVIVNSPKVGMVADAEQRKQIRNERMDQQKHASFESAASLAKELGADYMLVGSIDANVDKSMDGTKAAKFYRVTLELIDVEKNQKVWIEDKEIKKLVQRDKVNW